MHISDWKPSGMQDEEAQDRALLRLQAILLAASMTGFVMATAFSEASGRLACTAQPVIAPC